MTPAATTCWRRSASSPTTGPEPPASSTSSTIVSSPGLRVSLRIDYELCPDPVAAAVDTEYLNVPRRAGVGRHRSRPPSRHPDRITRPLLGDRRTIPRTRSPSPTRSWRISTTTISPDGLRSSAVCRSCGSRRATSTSSAVSGPRHRDRRDRGSTPPQAHCLSAPPRDGCGAGEHAEFERTTIWASSGDRATGSEMGAMGRTFASALDAGRFERGRCWTRRRPAGRRARQLRLSHSPAEQIGGDEPGAAGRPTRGPRRWPAAASTTRPVPPCSCRSPPCLITVARQGGDRELLDRSARHILDEWRALCPTQEVVRAPRQRHRAGRPPSSHPPRERPAAPIRLPVERRPREPHPAQRRRGGGAIA